jgi:hypothetical protein
MQGNCFLQLSMQAAIDARASSWLRLQVVQEFVQIDSG